MIDTPRTHTRPWPTSPTLAPLTPSRRVKGFAYAPPHEATYPRALLIATAQVFAAFASGTLLGLVIFSIADKVLP